MSVVPDEPVRIAQANLERHLTHMHQSPVAQSQAVMDSVWSRAMLMSWWDLRTFHDFKADSIAHYQTARLRKLVWSYNSPICLKTHFRMMSIISFLYIDSSFNGVYCVDIQFTNNFINSFRALILQLCTFDDFTNNLFRTIL